MPQLIDYRGYHIYFDPPPIPTRAADWHFYHDNYDAEVESDGTVIQDPRHGDGPSLEDCKAQIDEQIEEAEGYLLDALLAPGQGPVRQGDGGFAYGTEGREFEP